MIKSLKSALLILLSIATGLIFLYSAHTKLNPIQSFEYTIVQYVHFPWLISAILARILIGIEAGLGLLILLNVYGHKKWVLAVSMFIIIVFSIYLIFILIKYGNNVNCGCFGDYIWMNPISSIIKNCVLLLALIIIRCMHDGISNKIINISAIFIFLAVASLPFIIYGLPENKPNWLNKNKFKLDLSPIYNKKNTEIIPTINLQQGKHILAFLSLSCPHCRIAARKMKIMATRNSNIPFYFIIAGKNKYLASFWKETNAESIPHTKLDADSFTNMIGYSWPVIYFINNDTVEANTTYIALDQKEIEAWLQKK